MKKGFYITASKAYIRKEPNGEFVAFLKEPNTPKECEQENINLILAAPDLLEALELVQKEFVLWRTTNKEMAIKRDYCLQKIEQAINKAKGLNNG